MKSHGSMDHLESEKNPGQINTVPELGRLFLTDDAKNNKEVEVRTQCTVSKSKLDFGLTGQLFQVTPLGHAEPVFSETISLINNSGRDYIWQIVQAQDSPKYVVEAFPSTGKLRSKRNHPITIKFRIFCTTQLNIKLGIMLAAPKQRSIFSVGKKETLAATQDVLMLTFRAESDLSASIDYDELKVENKIASGAFGTVYKGMWRGIDIAVKKLHVQELTIEDKEIFAREIKYMRMLTCSYVVTLMGSTQIPGQPLCLVMEYIQGGALTNLLKTPISDKLKCKILLDIAVGMGFLHKSSIYHRDLKPDNVLVLSDSEDAPINIKITDFDTARTYLQDSNNYRRDYQSFIQAAKSTQQEIRTLSNMGTLIYKAPELIPPNTVDANLIEKTDVFSYGVLAYQVFTQKEPYSEPPYDRFTVRDIEQFVKKGDRLPIPNNVPKDMVTLISECWQPRARNRPSMEKIVSEVRSMLPRMLPKQPSSNAIGNVEIDGEFVPPIEQHSVIGWVGNLSREVAEQKLMDCPDGTFLIRWSSHAKSYVMSHKAPNRVEHIADICANPDKTITVVKSDNVKKHFPNLVEYMHAMKKMKIITDPIPLAQTNTSKEYERTPVYLYKSLIKEAEKPN